jgi:hypothetical protein
MRAVLSFIAIATIFVAWYSVDADIKKACGNNQACLAASL